MSSETEARIASLTCDRDPDDEHQPATAGVLDAKLDDREVARLRAIEAAAAAYVYALDSRSPRAALSLKYEALTSALEKK